MVGGDFDGGVGGGLAHGASSRGPAVNEETVRVSMVLAAVPPGCSRGPRSVRHSEKASTTKVSACRPPRPSRPCSPS